MKLPEDLSLARIVAQRLTEPLPGPLEAVRHLGCVQGQDLPGAMVSVALRTWSRSLAEVADAFERGELVRNWTMRGTLHVVDARHNGWILGLTGPRMESGQAARHRQLGIDEALVGQARTVAEELLAKQSRVTRQELFAAWDRHELLEEVAQRGIHLLSLLCRRGVLVLGPLRPTRTGWEQLVVLAEGWLGPQDQPDLEEALVGWAQAFFSGHGPATEADLARWTGLALGRVRRAMAATTGLLRVEQDREVWLMDASLPDRLAEQRQAAREVLLLPGFDELVLGYKDRSPVVPPQHAEAIVPGNNGMFRATVVRDGRVVGTWRRGTPRTKDPHPSPVVTWMTEPDADLLAGVEVAARALPR
ncbi:winged helix DNA-binding domain-containing protein [Luteococcus peritonei]|uniref:Winged helix DNA-binding domain-containing protein n=1 Tax=Luteococcus peritonei TaxID=88874 RepID=A0ABW4RXB9_9ACTN